MKGGGSGILDGSTTPGEGGAAQRQHLPCEGDGAMGARCAVNGHVPGLAFPPRLGPSPGGRRGAGHRRWGGAVRRVGGAGEPASPR